MKKAVFESNVMVQWLVHNVSSAFMYGLPVLCDYDDYLGSYVIVNDVRINICRVSRRTAVTVYYDVMPPIDFIMKVEECKAMAAD